MIAEKYMKNQYTRNNDLMHDGTAVKDVYVIESWIKEDDNDKSTKYGFGDLKIGTWFVAMKIAKTPEGDKVWEMVKSGELAGYSVSGWFEEVAAFCREEMFLHKVVEILKKYD
jgi:regulator of RNase E activity RraB